MKVNGGGVDLAGRGDGGVWKEWRRGNRYQDALYEKRLQKMEKNTECGLKIYLSEWSVRPGSASCAVDGSCDNSHL